MKKQAINIFIKIIKKITKNSLKKMAKTPFCVLIMYKIDNIKIYAIKGCLICLNITLLLTLQSSINQVFITNQNINYTNNQLEKSNEIKLTSSDLKQYIINSKNLSNQDKKLLINEKFFEDLTETQVTEDRYSSLDEKMTDRTITVGIDDKNNENLLGWYSDLYPNIIHLANE